MASSGVPAAAAAPATTAPASPAPTTAPPPSPNAQAAIAESLAALTTAVQSLQRQMGDMALRLTAVERGPAASATPALQYSAPLLLQYGMPGYGGIPAPGPVISELPSTALPATSAPGTQQAASSTVDAGVGSTQPPLTGLPIQSIPFPHSPSPLPSLSSIMNEPIMSSATVVHESPSRYHQPPSPEGSGVPRFHKLSFPVYDGKEDPLGWLNRCESFFRGQQTREADKVWLASFHMTGSAQQWFYVLERDAGRPSWDAFRLLCHQRFGPALSTNHLADLARLPFSSTVDAYMEAFQARLAHAGHLHPLQQAQLFTGGLPEHIRVDVELHEPQDLHRAMRLARAYERRNAPLALPAPPTRPPRRNHLGQNALPAPGAASTTPAPAARPFKRLTPAEMSERRKQGLCYNCDEPYVQGHKCARLFYLEASDYIVEEPEESEDEEQSGAASSEPTVATISLAAIAGVRTEDTMQVYITLGNEQFVALLDSGSTHNFIRGDVARRVGLHSSACPGRGVIVANGDRVECTGLARDVGVRIADEFFSVDCYSIPLDKWDMILGVTFLRTLGPILWDFDDLCMAFTREGRRVFWRGIGSTRHDVQSTRRLNSLRSSAPALLDKLLQSFDDVFATPQGLPPARACDHRIHLLPNSAPVAVRPYRYPQFQKDELESQCAAMLQQGVIRPSTSAFSAPVLLVKKQDGSWRFCVDYRALNKLTVKDKFPIPVVEELLDELQGARFFTKLDLRSGYHQVRMHEADIEKTAFRTHEGHFEFLVMPFGLTNAPATFQSLMNSVLRPFLRKFVLVFFDDILIYSPSWSAHLQHINAVLSALREHHLRLKQSKCSFATSSVHYLGHVISGDGVAMDQEKVAAVVSWPQPRSVRGLRGFLGLAGYYRRFIKNYGAIAAPLTALLKKEAFSWTEETTAAFSSLKHALSTAPVLQLPDFDKVFTVDCDASGTGFGAVLHQGSGALAFFSRPFAARHLKLAAYERELIGLVQAVRHWRPYLWGRHFVVRTDHYALKFMIDQRLSTVPQHQWVSKLFGYDFAVEYRPGTLNVVADALSRREEEAVQLNILTGPSFCLFEDLRQELQSNAELRALRDSIVATRGAPWQVVNGLIMRGNKVFIPTGSAALPVVLELAHTAGHEGTQKTLHRLRQDFVIDHDRRLVRDFVNSCLTCQRNKTEHLHPAGLLQPLEVPSQVWSDISLDFVEGLPRVHGKSVILTVVDRFSKQAHFLALSHPYTAVTVAKSFFEGIVRLHGFPTSIVSDRDPVFTGNVWKDLFKLAGVKLRMSTAFHPQTDGQSEVVNRTIAMYLRCLTGDRPRSWLDWLPWAEYCYNTSFHSALRTSPFEVVYGRPPPALLSYTAGTARTEAAETQMRDRDAFLADVRERLLQAQEYAKKHYDARHRPLEFQVDDWVLLRILHRPAQSLVPGFRGKLSPRFAGPFQVVERVGDVAYRLRLPEGARIHDVFHVGVLKPFRGTPPTAPPALPPLHNGRLLHQPARVLRSQLRRGVWHVLVQWATMPEAEATWEPVPAFRALFPSFQLADELFPKEGRDVMTGNTYQRRHQG